MLSYMQVQGLGQKLHGIYQTWNRFLNIGRWEESMFFVFFGEWEESMFN